MYDSFIVITQCNAFNNLYDIFFSLPEFCFVYNVPPVDKNLNFFSIEKLKSWEDLPDWQLSYPKINRGNMEPIAKSLMDDLST